MRVHLAKAARLIPRRHQQEIAAGEHAPGIGFIEADTHTDAARVTQRQLAHGLFFFRLAAADDRDLPALLDDVVGHAQGQVQALLIDQAGHHGE
ncbi:hypothetical protein D9M71_631530 [compost metagenome]